MEVLMQRQNAHPRRAQGLSRRELLQAGLAAGTTLSAWLLSRPSKLWGGAAGSPKHGGILRVRGYDPTHFDPHLTFSFKTHSTLSFVYSRLVRHQGGTGVQPGTFMVEPDLAERWEALDDTTYVFHLRKGIRWHNKPPLNGRELVAEDVKFTYDRFLTEPGNANRFMLDSMDRVEVVDRYTVKFRLKEPYVWLVNALAYPGVRGSLPQKWCSTSAT
jgi:ABC-type transport system substrate-binding protein